MHGEKRIKFKGFVEFMRKLSVVRQVLLLKTRALLNPVLLVNINM